MTRRASQEEILRLKYFLLSNIEIAETGVWYQN